jgi:energy-coupling factor transporter ATP-binding protein EcfA2
MLEHLTIESFKSIERVDVELGLVNFFIGANGSGKSNLLEGLGVLGAAADGRVDDQRLMMRGVRPGVPQLYKSAFPPTGSAKRLPTHILFGARSEDNAKYEVTLHNPLRDPSPAWTYKTELWEVGGRKLVGRSPHLAIKPNPEQGLAALKVVDVQETDPAAKLLRLLQEYVIYTPTTPVLRGTAPENQPKSPVGLSGGQLPEAVRDLLRNRTIDKHIARISAEVLELIDWAKSYGATSADKMPLSPAAASSPRVIRFVDRYMHPNRNVLSGYDASEGALYILFLAVLAGGDRAPRLCAVDNADHGLNPRLARALMKHLCGWILDRNEPRQLLLTTHNPLVLDGLPLQDDRVRLFSVSRTTTGRTTVRRIEVDKKLLEQGKNGWTLSRLWVMGHLGGVPNV